MKYWIYDTAAEKHRLLISKTINYGEKMIKAIDDSNTPPPEESTLLTILSNYSNDLTNLKKRNGKLPAQAAIDAIEKLILERERLARIDELKKLANEPSMPPDCNNSCKSRHWHHIAIGNINYRIKELNKQAIKVKGKV